MVGRTPAHIVATRPLVAGVISDFEVTEQMLRYFFEKVHKESFSILPRPRVVIGIPTGVTEVEKRAVEDAARNAGAREVYLIEEPMGNMIVDIGGGTTDVALISLGGIVTSRSLRIAGDKLSDDIVRYARDEFKLLLGERTAEEIKIGIGSAHELNEELGMPMRGRDLISGLPKEVIVNDFQIRKAMSHSVQLLVNAIKSAVEETPPELLADVMNRGIILAGGGSLLRGLDRLISEETKIPVKIAEDPLTAVVRGTGVVLEDIDALNEVLVTTQYEKAPGW